MAAGLLGLGSSYIGLLGGIIAIIGASAGSGPLLFVGLILLALFIFPAILTLVWLQDNILLVVVIAIGYFILKKK